jgi:ribosomal protein S27AE
MELIIMSEEREKCPSCGGTSFTASTELHGKKWIWKKVCKSCGYVLEERKM